MVAPGRVEGQGTRGLEPGGAQAKEVSAADAQELGGGVGIEVAAVEGFERVMEELYGKAFGQLVFCTRA